MTARLSRSGVLQEHPREEIAVDLPQSLAFASRASSLGVLATRRAFIPAPVPDGAVLPSRIVVHYGEIGTKGANRPVFEASLRRNIPSVPRPDERRAGQDGGQPLLRLPGGASRSRGEGEPCEGLRDRLVRAGRDASRSPIRRYSRETPCASCAARREGTSFRVSVRRPNKSFEMNSQELARKLGEDIVEALG